MKFDFAKDYEGSFIVNPQRWTEKHGASNSDIRQHTIRKVYKEVLTKLQDFF